VETEEEIRGHHARGQWSEAVTLGLARYGPEIFGFLLATTHAEDVADEVFARFSLDLWQGISGFRWQSSFRTWAYALARHAALRVLRNPHRRREVGWSDTAVREPVLTLRSETAPFLKSEIKTRATRLREQLPDQEQVLLILRVDKGLSWDEIAQILSPEPEASASDQRERARRAAALRKRFERIKDTLRDLARAEGLLE
jgi:RNA polymerase sigma-70 factor (ECF subfamily)